MPPPASQSLTHHQLHPHHHHHHHAATSQSDPVQLAHFVIFNPTLIPPKQRKRNKVDDKAAESTESTKSDDRDWAPLAPPSSESTPAHVMAPQTGDAVAAATGGTGSEGKSGEILESPVNPNRDDTDVASKTPSNDARSSKQQQSTLKTRDEDDPDLEDDLREAAQILFYTSHQAGRVSRDMMLRQVGLAKGLMGFTDMAAPAHGEKNVWAVHGSHSRMIVYAPLPNWYMYICIRSADSGVHSLSDRMLVAGLERGYHDFCLVHGAFDTHEPGHAFASQLERFFTRFTLAFEATYLSAPSLLTWLGGQAPSDPALREKLEALPPPVGATVGLITRGPDGVVLRASAGAKLDPPITDALMRYLAPFVTPPPAPKEEKKAERQALGFGFRRKEAKDLRQDAWTPLSWVGLAPRSASATPPPKPPAPQKVTASGGGRRWFGDIGGVFGLGSKPASPAPDAPDEAKETKDDKVKDGKAEAGAPVAEGSKASTSPKDSTDASGDAVEAEAGAEADDACGSRSDKDDTTPKKSTAVALPTAIPVRDEPGPMLAVSVGDSIVTSVASSGSSPSVAPSVSTLGHAHAAPSVATDMTDVTAAVERGAHSAQAERDAAAAPSLHASEGTTLVDDGASVRTARSTPSLIAPEGRPPSIAIQDALASEPDPWVQRTVYVPQRARLRWVVRNGAMVFVVKPEPEPDTGGTDESDVAEAQVHGSEPEAGSADLEAKDAAEGDAPKDEAGIDRAALKAVFAALEAPAPPASAEKLPLGVYHRACDGVTRVRPVPSPELVALANLRESGTSASFGQLPSGRFVARREEGGAELFVQTHRTGGITEAERVMRQWSYDCEAI